MKWLAAKACRLWRRLQARLRTDLTVVCEESRGMGLADYHDYPDDELGQPLHFCVLSCRRCGKAFII